MICVVGAGAAGLALATRLAAQGTPDVVLVSSPTPPAPRTWCSWHAGPQWWDEAVSHVWDRLELHGPDGVRQEHALAPLRYVMVRSTAYEQLADRLLEGRVQRVAADVAAVDGGHVVGEGVDLRADLVFDTRPVRTPPGLLQHFRGWFVRTTSDDFDPSVAGFMDFRVPQPDRGVAFTYVLPTSAREALVEHTLFSRDVWTAEQYDAALHEATAHLPPFEVLDVERGVIPMTSAPFARRVSERVFRLGAGGGATRPSTGYTFSGAQRQAAAVARAVAAGTDPTPPVPYPRRHLAMDALLLRAIAGGQVQGARFLADLFARQPTERVLRFLDGGTTPREDLAIMRSAPAGRMLRALASRP
ncbi:MAG: crtY [Frankiales bacterium]|nr:crtY [Frankiales bacterium]